MKKYGVKSAMITFLTKENIECITQETYKQEYEDGLSFLDDLESFVRRLKVRWVIGKCRTVHWWELSTRFYNFDKRGLYAFLETFIQGHLSEKFLLILLGHLEKFNRPSCPSSWPNTKKTWYERRVKNIWNHSNLFNGISPNWKLEIRRLNRYTIFQLAVEKHFILILLIRWQKDSLAAFQRKISWDG